MMILGDKEMAVLCVSRMEYDHFHDYASGPQVSAFYIKCHCQLELFPGVTLSMHVLYFPMQHTLISSFLCLHRGYILEMSHCLFVWYQMDKATIFQLHKIMMLSVHIHSRVPFCMHHLKAILCICGFSHSCTFHVKMYCR